jgi:hypothetical protein
LTGGSGTYVYTWQRKSVDGYYFVLIVAVSSGYESGGSYISSPSKTYRSYGCSTIKMLPEWWGLRRAQLSEVYYQTGGVNVKIPDDDRLLNIFNSPCEVGDYIARDATPESPGTPDRDSDYPFTEDLSIELIREYVGQEMSVPTFYVKFATNKAIGGFEDWYGVNGSFGTSSTSPSTTSSGKWKAVKQTVKEDQKIGSGTYNIVERWCVGTPTINSSKLTYDSDKNGGTWTW